jgi:hypothetical protein
VGWIRESVVKVCGVDRSITTPLFLKFIQVVRVGVRGRVKEVIAIVTAITTVSWIRESVVKVCGDRGLVVKMR